MPKPIRLPIANPHKQTPAMPTLADQPKPPSLAALKREAETAIATLAPFIGSRQLSVVRSGMRGEEARFFCEKMIELAGVVTTMAATYDQDGLGENATVYLHYFAGGSANWWITEKDKGDGSGDRTQHQAFGLANLFGGPTDQDAELGYISIAEILENHGELDFHFKPRTLAELKGAKVAAEKVVDFPAPPMTSAELLASM